MATTMMASNDRWIRTAGQVSSIGLLILVCMGIGLGLGYWLDSKLGTAPWLAFVMTLFGLAAGIYESVKILIRATRDADE